MKHVVWLLILLLVVLHQDNWFWDDATLVWGFMPIGLLYQASISIAAACVWYLATRVCWPDQAEEPPAAHPREAHRG